MRNRSKELAELLGDVDRIRAERKKARANRNKFGGVEGGTMSGGMSGGSRYGGFGSEDSGGYGSSSAGVYGDGGGFGGNTSGFHDSSRRNDRFDEDDEYDEDTTASSARRRTGTTATEPVRVKKAEPPKPKEPEIDILSFDNDIPPETPPKEFSSNGKAAATSALENDEDDFDDFQSASPTTTAAAKPSVPGIPAPMTTSAASPAQFAAPQPFAPSQGNNINDLFSSVSPAPSATSGVVSPPAPNYNISSPSTASVFQSPAPSQQPSRPQAPQPTGYQAATPNYFTSVQAPTPTSQQPPSIPAGRPLARSSNTFSQSTAKPSSSGGDAFASLWSSTSAGAGIKKTPTPGTGGPKLADMQKQKAAAGIWGALAASSAASPMQQPAQSNGQKTVGGGAFDDLLG